MSDYAGWQAEIMVNNIAEEAVVNRQGRRAIAGSRAL